MPDTATNSVTSEHPAAEYATARLLAWLRWAWLLMALVLQFFYAGPAALPMPFTYVVLAIGAGLALLLLVLSYTRVSPSGLITGGAAVDILVASLLVLVTGGRSSPMLPVALFPVLVVAVRYGVLSGLGSALPLVVVYSIGVIPGVAVDNAGPRLPFLLNVLVLVIGATTAGLVAHRDAAPTAAGEENQEIRELRLANRRATVIQEMATILSSTLDYKRVLRTMLDLIVIALGEDSRSSDSLIGAILLVESEGDFSMLRLHAGRNIPRSDEGKLLVGQEGIIHQAIFGAEPVINNEPTKDPMLSNLLSIRDTKSVLCVPLRAGFDTFGVVVVASPTADRFGAHHAELLTTFSHQAVISLRNAQLYQDLQTEQRRLLEKEAEARHKLARELHDGPTQTISAIVMRLNFARMMLEKNQPQEKIVAELNEIEEMARYTTQEIRTMLFTLRPVVLETQGLVAALKRYADRLRQGDGLNVKVDVQKYAGQLDTEAEGVVFSIVEEAIGNVKKHAQAKNVLIRLLVRGPMVSAEIIDDGVGFDANAAKRRREVGHLGLLNIEERATILGGRYQIESQPGKGTLVRVEIPVGMENVGR